MARHGMARFGRAWRGKAGEARLGVTWQGRARLAWRGGAGLGEAWQGQPKERKKIFRKETTCTSTTV